MTNTKWTVETGRVYVRKDNKFMVKNVGHKCWGVFVNDGESGWDIDWVGSVYPTAKNAMNAADRWNFGGCR